MYILIYKIKLFYECLKNFIFKQHRCLKSILTEIYIYFRLFKLKIQTHNLDCYIKKCKMLFNDRTLCDYYVLEVFNNEYEM